MKNKLLTILFALILPVLSFGAMRDAAILTGSYVASESVDIRYSSQISVIVTVSGTPQSLTCYLVPQWSADNTNWIDEPVNIASSSTATEQPYTRLSKRFDFSVNSSGVVFGETFNRWGGFLYFRVKVMESTGVGTTTALVKIVGYASKENP